MHEEGNTAERWRSVVRLEASHEVSDHGQIRTIDRVTTDARGRTRLRRGLLIRQWKNSQGYCMVSIGSVASGIKLTGKAVHRLVLEAFVGPCPEGMEACHENGIRTDNRLQNLRWASRAENMADRDRHGTTQRGETHFKAKLTASNVHDVRAQLRAGVTAGDIATQFGVTRENIYAIRDGKTWRHLESP